MKSAFLGLIFALQLAAPAWAADGCMAQHLREAIALNRERMPRYSALTDGKSERISRTWIFLEGVVLKTQFLFDPDEEARIYEDAGIHLICNGLVPMSTVPAFSKTFALGAPDLRDFHSVWTIKLEIRVKYLMQRNRFRDAWQAVVDEIHATENEKRFNCVTRHLLESMARFLGQAEAYNKRAVTKGLPSSLDLSKRIVRSHFTALQSAFWIDLWASEIQARGVPMLCNDVPPIAFPYLD